jgi:hypothetical protein
MEGKSIPIWTMRKMPILAKFGHFCAQMLFSFVNSVRFVNIYVIFKAK